MLLTFLFWNVNKRPLQERVSRIVTAHAVDVVILAEWDGDPGMLLAELNAGGAGTYTLPYSSSNRLVIVSRLPENSINEEFNDPLSRLTIRRLHTGPPPGIILAASHLVSAVNWDKISQGYAATAYADDIAKVELKLGHTRTIWVGDFNMNPFHEGMTAAQGVHAVMTKDQAGKERRQVLGRAYSYFYNPMWGFFGDRSEGPAGTHYYSGSESVTYFWNIYDQVLLRPALMHNLFSVSILEEDGSQSLLNDNGTPDTVNSSDHLPLLFILDL